MKKDSFWRWYLKGCKSLLSWGVEFFREVFTAFEYLAGIAIGATGIIFSIFSSLWFLLLIPVGITLTAHGYWREFVRTKND